MAKKHARLSELEQQILAAIQSSPRSEGELGREFHKSAQTIQRALKNLKLKGYPVFFNPAANNYFYDRKPITEFSVIPDSKLYGKLRRLKSLSFSETHYGGLQDQPHLTPILREVGEAENVDVNTHSGDVTNGLKHKDYPRGQNIVHTVDGQIERAVNALSCLDRETHAGAGDHDHWGWTELGVDVVSHIVKDLNAKLILEGKPPLFHYVNEETWYQFEKNGIVVELIHPYKGKARAFSYAPQLVHEDRLGEFVRDARGEAGGTRQPHVGKYGNWHVEIIFYQGGTIHELVPGLQGPTKWEHDKGLIHEYGAWVSEVAIDETDHVFGFDYRYIDLAPYIRRRTVKKVQDASVTYDTPSTTKTVS